VLDFVVDGGAVVAGFVVDCCVVTCVDCVGFCVVAGFVVAG